MVCAQFAVRSHPNWFVGLALARGDRDVCAIKDPVPNFGHKTI